MVVIVSMTVSADVQPLISVGYEQIEGKYKASFAVSHNPGISSFKFSVLCKDGTMPKEVIKNDGLNGGIFQSNISQTAVVEDGRVVTVLWINSENYKTDGELFSIMFETQDLSEPVIYLSYENGDVIDEDFNDIQLVIDEKLVIPEEKEPEKPEEEGDKNTSASRPSGGSGSLRPVQKNPVEQDEKIFPFTDVKESEWYYEAVKFAFEKGITSGVSKTEYAPNDKVTRGQFITMLLRAYGIKERTGDNFDDCGNTWYTGYLAAAKQLGISSGVGDNKFAPEKEISREEMVTLIYNYLKSVGKVDDEIKETTFADDDIIADWAKTGVAFASDRGYIKGKGDNLFDPKSNATRAELAQIFSNIFK